MTTDIVATRTAARVASAKRYTDSRLTEAIKSLPAVGAPAELTDKSLEKAIRQYEAGGDIATIAQSLGSRSVALQIRMKKFLGEVEWKETTVANIESSMHSIAAELRQCVDKEDATYAGALKTLLDFQRWRAEKLAAHIYAPPKQGLAAATFTINMAGLSGATMRMTELSV